MLWRDMICNRKQCVYTIWLIYKQNEKYRICNNRHVFVHASKALYQLYNLCMSHHETIHARHILQVTLLASICVNIAVQNNIKQSIMWCAENVAGKK